jgi:hypothetical protein
MKGNASPSNGGEVNLAASARVVRARQHRVGTYQKIRDERKHPIRGLRVRNGGYYAHITIEDNRAGQKAVRRVRLEKAATIAQAVSALAELKVQRRKGNLPVLKRTPTFADFADDYLDFHTRLWGIQPMDKLAPKREFMRVYR